jgi:hypothetical protein
MMILEILNPYDLFLRLEEFEHVIIREEREENSLIALEKILHC